MPDLQTWPLLDAAITLAVLAGMFVMFLRESYPTEVVALLGAALLVVTGVLSMESLLGVLSNPAPWTIAAMFVLSGAVVRTGLLNGITAGLVREAAHRPLRVIAILGTLTLFASAFMNNTPVVVLMIPITVRLAQSMKLSASKLLIPLSYVTIFGGMCTLIGTSTNLLVDGVARAQGLEPFTLFELTPMAIILAAFGVVYLRILGPKLLPDRFSMSDALVDRKRMSFFTEVAVPEDSSLIGENVLAVELFKRDKMRVIDVLRGDESLRRSFPDVALQAGDRVVLKTDVAELMGLKESRELHMVDTLSSRKTETVEALISPGCTLVGRSLGSLRLRRRYGVYPLAVHRRNQNLGRQLEDVIVRVGDTLLLEGAPEDIQRLANDVDLVDLAKPEARSYRRRHAPLVLGILVAVVVGAALEIAPLLALAFIGVALVFATRAIDADEAFGAIDGRLLALIFAMLAIGAALQESGAVQLIVDPLAPWIAGLPPSLVIWCVFLLTSVLTELVSNNAVAVVITPIAIALAHAIGVDPRPLVVAVMIAASASFATPIGYQTNTLVYGPGGYKFTDFMRIGIPLNLSLGVLTSLLVPYFWPL
ncbi:MAG: SLC13 family permease [Paracoccaceae bacterium]